MERPDEGQEPWPRTRQDILLELQQEQDALSKTGTVSYQHWWEEETPTARDEVLHFYGITKQRSEIDLGRYFYPEFSHNPELVTRVVAGDDAAADDEVKEMLYQHISQRVAENVSGNRAHQVGIRCSNYLGLFGADEATDKVTDMFSYHMHLVTQLIEEGRIKVAGWWRRGELAITTDMDLVVKSE